MKKLILSLAIIATVSITAFAQNNPTGATGNPPAATKPKTAVEQGKNGSATQTKDTASTASASTKKKCTKKNCCKKS